MGMFSGMQEDEWDEEYENHYFDAPNQYLAKIKEVKVVDQDSRRWFIVSATILAKKNKDIGPDTKDTASYLIPLWLKRKHMGISRKRIKAFIIAGYGEENLCESFELSDIRKISEANLEQLAEEVIDNNAFEGEIFVVKSTERRDKDTGEVSQFPNIKWLLADESDYEKFGYSE